MGKTLFGGFNLVHTGGPMQVSIAFAEKQARNYPYLVIGSIRREVFTGGAHVLRHRPPARLPGEL